MSEMPIRSDGHRASHGTQVSGKLLPDSHPGLGNKPTRHGLAPERSHVGKETQQESVLVRHGLAGSGMGVG